MHAQWHSTKKIITKTKQVFVSHFCVSILQDQHISKSMNIFDTVLWCSRTPRCILYPSMHQLNCVWHSSQWGAPWRHRVQSTGGFNKWWNVAAHEELRIDREPWFCIYKVRKWFHRGRDRSADRTTWPVLAQKQHHGVIVGVSSITLMLLVSLVSTNHQLFKTRCASLTTWRNDDE